MHGKMQTIFFNEARHTPRGQISLGFDERKLI